MPWLPAKNAEIACRHCVTAESTKIAETTKIADLGKGVEIAERVA